MLFCKVKYLSLILLFIYASSYQAQMLDNTKGVAFTDLPYFNEKFIKKNQVKSLKGNFQYKKTGDMIRKSNYVYEYYFDREGRITHSLETHLIGNVIDTIALYYEYDSKNRLHVLRQRRNGGYVSSQFKYDDKNRVIETAYYNDIDTTTNDIYHPKFERSTYINSEHFEYQDMDGNTKKTYFNNYDFPYLEEFLTYNKWGLLEKKDQVLKMTSDRTLNEYSYNEKGWITEIKTTKSKKSANVQRTTFNYDSFGNLTEQHFYNGENEAIEIQIIYSKATGLLLYTLKRDVETGLITILKIDKVEYYH